MKSITSKQKGDACEMLVVAELTLAGTPAMRIPDNWPGYDVIAQPEAMPPQRISVKAREWKIGGSQFVDFLHDAYFEWIAAVIIMPSSEKEYQREIYVIPRQVFIDRAKRSGVAARRDKCYCRIDRISDLFSEYRDNFGLLPAGIGYEEESPPEEG